MGHLRIEHGFPKVRARGIASRLVSKERLSAGDCRRLGIPVQAVTLKGAINRRLIEQSCVPPGLPDDLALDAAIRAAGFGA